MRVICVVFCLFGFINFEILSQSETVKCEVFVYDYFKNQRDSAISMASGLFIMPFDSVKIEGENEYCYKKQISSEGNGFLEIFFKNKLLFKYTISDENISGTGICYYPFNDNKVALIGEFKKSKLNGNVYVFDNKGVLVEVIKYKNGKYKKHLFHISRVGREFKYKGSKNPLRLDYEIILY